MTKSNPEILCPSCEEFDYIMNRQSGISLDVFVVCDHDYKENVSEEEHKMIDALYEALNVEGIGI